MTFISLLFASLLGLSLPVQSIPQLSFPINAQIPPLAVVSQPFTFTFSPSTFSYDSPSVSYSVSNNTPSWLAFDAFTRTFSGTPAVADVGNFSFTLSASDEDGTAAGDVTFIVVQEDGISVGRDVATQLISFGGVDGNGGIVLSAQEPFSWTFAEDTFTSSDTPVETYYAVSTGTNAKSFVDRSTYPLAELDSVCT
jgi:axial budding pattern protein 2